MKLTVLGKYGPYPKAGSGACSCYLVEENGRYLVLDMGAGSLSRLAAQVDIRQIKGIYLSHLHYDHTSDLLPFRYLLEDLGHKVDLFVRKADSEWYDILTSHRNFNVVDIGEGPDVDFEGFRLSFFEMKHTVPCYAIKIKGEKTLVYTGDTLYNDNIRVAVDGADCVLADCSKPEGFNGPHMTVDKAVKLHLETGVRIIATHLSPGYSPDKEFAAYDGITVAEELHTYNI